MYIAQANIGHGKFNINKGQSVSDDDYKKLPPKLKIKFVQGKAPAIPIAYNEVIGDTPEEKAKRDALVAEDATKKKGK